MKENCILKPPPLPSCPESDLFFLPFPDWVTIRCKLSYQSLILIFSFLLPSQLGICSSKVLDDLIEVMIRLRMLSNLNKPSIINMNVSVQSEVHWEIEEVLDWFEVRAEKSSLAFEIEISIQLAFISFNWEIGQLDTSMVEHNSGEILYILVCS